jgi:hypothetical protein
MVKNISGQMNVMKTFAAIVALSVLFACDKDDRIKLDDQILYFEYCAINYAWGFQYSHWVIDRNGNVLANTNTDSIIQINENDIKYGNASFDSALYKVDRKELEHYINLIPSASRGKIKCEDQQRADFGGISFSAFYRDKTILLSSMSDIEDCTNNNNDAVKIDKWLNELQYKIYSQN